MDVAIAEHEEELQLLHGGTSALFEIAATDWLWRMEHVNGSKPSTLDVYRYFLTPPGTPARERGRRHADGRCCAPSAAACCT